MVDVNDEVELTKHRIGIIRYKGPLEGKNGIFYGVELTNGKGKHNGAFRGKKYFTCRKTKGIFVKKKQILYKLEDRLLRKLNPNKNHTNSIKTIKTRKGKTSNKKSSKKNKKSSKKNKKIKSKTRFVRSASQQLDCGKFTIPRKSGPIQTKKRKSKTRFGRASSQEIGYGKFKIPRKTGPAQEKKSSNKSDWKPPLFMKEVMNDIVNDYGWLNERLNRRGKFQAKTKYEKAGYLPHAKAHLHLYKPEEWATFLEGIEQIQADKQMIEWENELQQKEKDIHLGINQNEEYEQKRIALQKEIKILQSQKNKLVKEEEQRRIKCEHEQTLTQQITKEQILLEQQRVLLKREKHRKRKTELELLQLLKAEQEQKEQINIQKQKELDRLKRLGDEERERQNMQQIQLEKERKQLQKERQRMQNELDRKINEMKTLETEKQKTNERRRKAVVDERIKLEKIHTLLETHRTETQKDEAIAMDMQYGESSDEERKREDSPVFRDYWKGYEEYNAYNKSKPKRKTAVVKTLRTKKKLFAPQTKDYKIFFNVNIETAENIENIINNNSQKTTLRYLLSDLFGTESEKNVFQIKLRKKANGFKIDFGILIATTMHPSDYIDTFDDLTMDGSFQETIKEAFDLWERPHIHVWEARYEKISHKKLKKRKKYY